MISFGFTPSPVTTASLAPAGVPRSRYPEPLLHMNACQHSAFPGHAVVLLDPTTVPPGVIALAAPSRLPPVATAVMSNLPSDEFQYHARCAALTSHPTTSPRSLKSLGAPKSAPGSSAIGSAAICPSHDHVTGVCAI